MPSLPTWFLRCLVQAMIVADVAMITTVSRFPQGLTNELIVVALLIPILTVLPYVGAIAASFAFKYQLTQWALLLGMLPIAVVGFFSRAVECGVARNVWHARVSGEHYMNCGPPVRLGIWILEYGGTATIVGVAGLLFLVQFLIAGSNTPSPPSPPLSRGRNTPR